MVFLRKGAEEENLFYTSMFNSTSFPKIKNKKLHGSNNPRSSVFPWCLGLLAVLGIQLLYPWKSRCLDSSTLQQNVSELCQWFVHLFFLKHRHWEGENMAITENIDTYFNIITLISVILCPSRTWDIQIHSVQMMEVMGSQSGLWPLFYTVRIIFLH